MSYFFAVGVRKFALLLGAVLTVTLLTACSQSPESVVRSYFKAVADNRTEEAVGYFSLKDVKESDLTMVKGKFRMFVGGQYSVMQEKGGLDSISTTLVDQNDATANVAYEIKYKNGETEKDTLPMVKDSGQWKIQLK